MKIKLTPYEANFGEMGGIDGPIIIADVDLTEEQKNQLLDSIKMIVCSRSKKSLNK